MFGMCSVTTPPVSTPLCSQQRGEALILGEEKKEDEKNVALCALLPRDLSAFDQIIILLYSNSSLPDRPARYL